MIDSRRSLLVTCLGLSLWAAPAYAQDDATAKKVPDPKVTARLAEFSKHIRAKKFARDDDAIGIVDELLQRWESLHPKNRAGFLKALSAVFKGKKRKADNQRLYIAASAALGAIGAAGEKGAAKILVGNFDKKPFSNRDWVSLRERMLENIGKAADEKQIKFLTKAATRDPDARIKAAAGKALRYYAASSQQVRKAQIVKILLRDYARIEAGAQANANPGDSTVQTRRATLRAIADPWNTTLQAMTGAQDPNTAAEWQKWWNKNKAKNWDKNRK